MKRGGLFIWLAFVGALGVDSHTPRAEVFTWGQVEFKNGTKLKVEVAQTFWERAKGLMGRPSLPQNQGMLFIFDSPQKLSFWMKDTLIPLSVAYLDQYGVIQEIYHMNPEQRENRPNRLHQAKKSRQPKGKRPDKKPKQQAKIYPSRCECQYALEVNQGWFKKHKIKRGDRLFSSLLKGR